MATTRSRSGSRTPSQRRHVGLTLPRTVKERLLEASAVMDWSAGDWVLAIAAEQGPRLRGALDGREVRKRPTVPEAAFTALYLTPEEREELDDQAVACRLNRSAFVTAVAQLGLGDDLDEVVAPLLTPASPSPDASDADPSAPRARGPGSSEPGAHERGTPADGPHGPVQARGRSR